MAQLAFNEDGTKLASVGLDDSHSIAVYDWQKKRLIFHCRGSRDRTLTLTWLDYDTLVTGNIRGVVLYHIQGRNVKTKKVRKI